MTILDAIPKLLKLQKNPASAALILGCRGVPHAMPDSAQDVPDLDWSTCPLCLARRVLTPLRDVAAMAEVSPLSGWPDRFAYWAIAGILQVRR